MFEAFLLLDPASGRTGAVGFAVSLMLSAI
jgi:hypothetical protein